MASLDDLVAAYLSPAVTAHRESSSVELVVDGRTWMLRMRELLTSLEPGDAAYICGLQIEPEMDLTGKRKGDPGYEPLGGLLAGLASRGIDVRVLLAGAVVSSSIARPTIGPFHQNVSSAHRLRRWRGPTAGPPPLANRVLLDWSGSGIGSNHQKVTLVRRGAEITAGVGGIDYAANRVDESPHDRLSINGGRWGWHDAGAILRGPAAADVWRVLRMRWSGAASLPRKRYIWPSVRGLQVLNPSSTPAGIAPPPAQPDRPSPGVACQILRSVGPWYIDSLLPWERRHYNDVAPEGVHEVYLTLVQAINAARRYVYIEDQYFREYPGGDRRFEMYAHLRAAAARGVKVILLGSGSRDPAESSPLINGTVNADLQKKVLDPLPQQLRRNVGLWRVEHLTVHSKIVIVDDRFAAVGSANLFSRSMAGVDTELTAAVVSTGDVVRDLRVRLWAEHLRAPLTDDLRKHLEDLDLAIGMFRPEWLPPRAPAGSWRTPGIPDGFAPLESVLTLVGPP
ncbi:phosphatidylserine/phosphatidylglycerophosphate/cardiolipin synthase family protein [Paractinoplanes rhizophilus]|jgi:phosphatidylserine/phosphatidylglycerophosphate/cardiolipin synthase-like enzyme|uniref:Phosphatidylserine/phosphatidylglycerophosphate/ cardiolipin synthase family protein n=1 Tax=Paractinoplanes rhizophilus TaxID=1416877 RepID=A0ABW2I5F2_9ACTN|nr:phospholipase D-like domain-containing protein [Actinoplanes sp.]